MWKPLILALGLLLPSVLYTQSSPESLGPVTLAPEEYQAIEQALMDSSATLTLAKTELAKLKEQLTLAKKSLIESTTRLAQVRKLLAEQVRLLTQARQSLIQSSGRLTQALTRIDQLLTSCEALEDEIDKLSAQVWIAAIVAFVAGLGIGLLVGRLSAAL